MGCKVSKWQDKSNEEINVAVNLLQLTSDLWVYDKDRGVLVVNETGDKLFVLNYCGEWGYAGPLIESEKIDLTYDGAFTKKFTASHTRHVNDFDVDLIGCNDHENPLRAAMIVYLEINGVQPNE